MGKTAAGAVWLNADMRSPYDYWQFWRNTEDGDVGRFLRLFTDLPLDEIARLEKLQGAELNEAKKILATEATALCMAARRRSRPPKPRAAPSRKARWPPTCRHSRSRVRSSRRACPWPISLSLRDSRVRRAKRGV